MSIPPQPPSPENSEQQPVLHSSEEQTPLASPQEASNETEQEQQQPDAAEIPTQPAPSAEPERSPEETEPQLATSKESDTAQDTTVDEHNLFTTDDIEATTLENDHQTFETEQSEPALPQTTQSGIFIGSKVLIGAISALVIVALLVTLLVFVNRPKDPPTDWIASYTPPAGTSSVSKILYYLHWTNQNGKLDGQLQLAANANGTTQSLTAPATGLYNRDDHIIYVVVTINGQPGTLTGTINANNDTLTLNEVGSPTPDSQIIFHTGSANDYKQQTQKLGNSKK